MRWHVQGTDAATGKRLAVTLSEHTATDAVQAAMAKGVVVSQVARCSRVRLVSFAVTLLLTGLLILGNACAILNARERDARKQAAAALAEEARLASALTDSGDTIAALQRRTQALELAHGGAARQLLDQLEAARVKTSQLDAQLAKAKTRVLELEKHSANTAHLTSELSAAQSEAARLSDALEIQRQRGDRLDGAQAAADSLEKTNHDLAVENAMLKAQLLEQVAKSATAPVLQTVDPLPRGPAPRRWAMRLGYDAALGFLALRFDKDSIATEARAPGVVSTTGVNADSAATLRFLHDAAKSRLYSATLSVSLSADGPPARIAANEKLVLDFLHQFAASFKASDVWMADTIKQLAGKPASERVMRLGDDFKLTVWNNRQGLYSWRVESPRADLDE